MTRILDEIAFRIGLLGLVLTGISTFFLYNRFLNSPSTLNLFLFMYVGFAFLGFLFYIYRKGRPVYEPNALTDKMHNILTILFLIVIIGILLVLKSSIYTKPLSYYLLVSLATALVGIQIIGDVRPHKILIQIGLLALLIRSSSFIINPYLFGPDSYWHFNKIMMIVREGHLSNKAGHYYFYPAFHLLISFLEKTVAPTEVVFSITNLILSLIAVLIIYLITKDILDERIGLMCSLLLAISTFHIFGSINSSPMIIGFSLLLLGFYVLIKFSRPVKTSEYIRTWIMFWLTALFVFFVHPVASMTLGLILGANFLVIYFFLKDSKRGLTPVFSYIIGFVAYLMFVHFSLFKEIIEVIFIPGESQALPSIIFIAPTKNLLVETSFSYLGPASLLIFGVYGGLKWLEKYNLKKIIVLFCTLFLYSIPIYSFFLGSGGLDPGRMLAYIEIFIIIPAATGLFYLSMSIKNSKYRFALISSVLVFLAFFSTFSYITWDGNSFLKSEVNVPIGFATQSVVLAHPFIDKLSVQKSIYMDHRTQTYINNAERGILELNQKTLDISYSALKNEGYFVVNVLYLEMSVWGKESDKKNFFKRVEDGDKIYDNGNVQVFEK